MKVERPGNGPFDLQRLDVGTADVSFRPRAGSWNTRAEVAVDQNPFGDPAVEGSSRIDEIEEGAINS
jgi:hypothetical protein